MLRYKLVKEGYSGMTTTDTMRDEFFFGLFAKCLRDETSSVYPVMNAKNPILKVHTPNLDVDISFALVANQSLKLSAVSDLQPIDEQSQSAIMAVRVCLEITLILSEDNLVSFQQLLRDVKKWAISRQIYGQNYCYLGGISLAILSAFVV